MATHTTTIYYGLYCDLSLRQIDELHQQHPPEDSEITSGQLLELILTTAGVLCVRHQRQPFVRSSG